MSVKVDNMNRRKESKNKFTIRDIVSAGVMVALIEVCKIAFSFLPNIELTSFLLIIFTIYSGWSIVLVVPAFILIEGCIYGFGLWWFMYLYAWPLLVLTAWIFRKKESVWFWSTLSGAFGLCFGLLCTVSYVIVGITQNGIQNGLYAGFTWWVAGIPWDITHCIGNFVIMSVLFKPMRNVMSKIYN